VSRLKSAKDETQVILTSLRVDASWETSAAIHAVGSRRGFRSTRRETSRKRGLGTLACAELGHDGLAASAFLLALLLEVVLIQLGLGLRNRFRLRIMLLACLETGGWRRLAIAPRA
jgi:hypothetical protein